MASSSTYPEGVRAPWDVFSDWLEALGRIMCLAVRDLSDEFALTRLMLVGVARPVRVIKFLFYC